GKWSSTSLDLGGTASPYGRGWPPPTLRQPPPAGLTSEAPEGVGSPRGRGPCGAPRWRWSGGVRARRGPPASRGEPSPDSERQSRLVGRSRRACRAAGSLVGTHESRAI